MIKNAKEFYADFMQLHLDGGLKRGFDTGWKSLDEYYSIHCGDLAIVTGIPNSGKSEWMDDLMINLAEKQNFRWLVFSPENYPVQTHMAKLSEKHISKSFSYGRYPMTLEETDAAAQWMQKHFDFYDAGVEGVTPDQLIADASRWASEIDDGVNLGMVIDPWNDLDSSSGSEREDQVINRILGMCRRFARFYKVALFMVAHPTKQHKNADGTYSCPDPYSISGASHWRNRADVCIAVHRNHGISDGGMTEVHIQKVRGKHIGKVGVVEMRWDRLTGKYSDVRGDYSDLRG